MRLFNLKKLDQWPTESTFGISGWADGFPVEKFMIIHTLMQRVKE